MTHTFTYEGKPVTLSLHDDDIVCQHYIVGRNMFFEQEMLEYIREAYTFRINDGTIVDVGAHVGSLSHYFFRYLPCKNLVAFEPHAPSFKHLVRNLHLWPEALAIFGAVSNEQGVGTLGFVTGDPHGGQILYGEDSEGVKVPTYTLDDFYNQGALKYTKLLKIDVEGNEPLVLQGAMKLITDLRPIIFMEANHEEELETQRKILEPLGYTLGKMWDDCGKTYEWISPYMKPLESGAEVYG